MLAIQGLGLAGTKITSRTTILIFSSLVIDSGGEDLGLKATVGAGTAQSVTLHQNLRAGVLLICAASWGSGTASSSMSDPNNGTWKAIATAKPDRSLSFRFFTSQ